MTVFGGMNDVIAPRVDFDAIRAEHVIVFSEARRDGCTVVTFTMPDPAAINPLGARLRERVSALNQVIRSEAERFGVLVLDFEAYPVAEDPRLWFEDRLHGNTLGHTVVAKALAWRLGIPGFDETWAQPLDGEMIARTPRERMTGDFDWAVHYLAPWLGRGIRRLPHGLGIDPKRPIPMVVPKSELASQSAQRLRRIGPDRRTRPRPRPAGWRTGRSRCAAGIRSSRPRRRSGSGSG